MALRSNHSRGPVGSRSSRRASSRAVTLRVVAFKENDAIKDWRVQQMVDTCHSYYAALWGRGQLAAADALLDPAVVHRDLCGAWLVHVGQPGAGVHAAQPATGLTVGPRGVKALVADVRQQYPDMYVQVDELAVSDTHRIFVAWTRYGTQLGSPGAGGTAGPGDSSSSSSGSSKQQHSQWLGAGGAPVRQGSPAGPAAAAGGGGSAPLPPSYHSGLIRGVDLITFNHDRSRILEVDVFRQLSADERREAERRMQPHTWDIRLARLHWS